MEKIISLYLIGDDINLKNDDNDDIVIRIPNMYCCYKIILQNILDKEKLIFVINHIFNVGQCNSSIYFDDCFYCMIRVNMNITNIKSFLQEKKEYLLLSFIDNIIYEIVLSRINFLLNNLIKKTTIPKMTQKEINSLEYTEINSDTTNINCVICLEDVTQCIKLPCGHCYHKECCTKWLTTNASCPICRMNIKDNLPKPTFGGLKKGFLN